MTDRSIAVCSWSLQPTDPADLVRDVTLTGVRGVQLALSPLIQNPDTWKGIADRLRDAGIEIISGMMAMEGEDYRTLESIALTGGLRPDATWPANRAHAIAVAELAGDLGLDLVTFHAGFLPEAAGDERSELLKRLTTFSAIFSASGVRLGLETGQETAEGLAGVLGELNDPAVGVNFDPANMILYGMGDPVAAIETLAPHVMQVHIKDAWPADVPGTWGEEVPVGDGAVDWDAFLAVVDRHDVACVIEREAGMTRVADIRRAAERLEQSS